MVIEFDCACGKRMKVAEEHAGKRVWCPECREVNVIPAAETASAEPVLDEAAIVAVTEPAAVAVAAPPPAPAPPGPAPKAVPSRSAPGTDPSLLRGPTQADAWAILFELRRIRGRLGWAIGWLILMTLLLFGITRRW